jgi:hypothetical protein
MNHFSKFVVIMCTSIAALVSFGSSEADSRSTAVNIVVNQGDTVWKIASRINEKYYNNEKDIRDITYGLRSLNEIEGSLIYSGDELMYDIE